MKVEGYVKFKVERVKIHRIYVMIMKMATPGPISTREICDKNEDKYVNECGENYVQNKIQREIIVNFLKLM